MKLDDLALVDFYAAISFHAYRSSKLYANRDSEEIAKWAYDDAEALVSEGSCRQQRTSQGLGLRDL